MFRDHLYELVWAVPVVKLAKEQGISDVAFAKTCKLHNIPLPPRGHWAKIEAGKKVFQQPLPERALGMPREVSFAGDRWNYYGPTPTNLVELELRPPPPFEEPISIVRGKLEKKVKKIAVARDMAMAHPVIRKLLEADAPRRQKYLAATYKSRYDQPYFDSPFEQRRLRLLNALFLCLEKFDARVSSSGKNPHEFGVRVGLTSLTISIDDPKVERASWYSSSEITKSASSPLAVKIDRGGQIDGVQTTWIEDQKTRLDGSLTDVAINVLLAGEQLCRAREVSHYEWLVKRRADLIAKVKREKDEAEKAARERRIREEEERVKRLLGEARALNEAQEIRKYVESVREINSRSEDPVADEQIEKWCLWALEQADRIDPVLSRRFLRDQ
ncbi:UNVERIFIED_ORG: flagellar biosynthesis/type III secretory pathway chaperone [Rhizobium esperanzae]